MSDVLSKKICPACGGTGREYDRKTINKLVKDLAMDLQSVASALVISPSYLTKLMHGERRWSPEIVEKLMEMRKAA